MSTKYRVNRTHPVVSTRLTVVLARQLDALAKAHKLTRSEFLSCLILRELNRFNKKS